MKRELAATHLSIAVARGDVLAFPADVLVLKHAGQQHGADRAAVRMLVSGGALEEDQALPELGDALLVPAGAALACHEVLFLGVEPLRAFHYREIRAFGRRALETLALARPACAHVALTLHGPGYGLDESEAFEAELAGLIDALHAGDYPPALRRVTIVERNTGRAERLSALLTTLVPKGEVALSARPGRQPEAERLLPLGYDSQAKPHVFVAMPFVEEMDDVFHYAIQNAAHAAGYLCERADVASFSGDIVAWIKERIASAALVIADLSDANPNVYLEVGYAWGCGRPTILLVKDVAELRFDVKGQRCIVYKRIKDLEAALRQELSRVTPAPGVALDKVR